jgi:hypothetical protein
VALLAGIGVLLAVGWKTFAVPAGEALHATASAARVLAVVPPEPSHEDAGTGTGTGAPVRGPARVERVDLRPALRPRLPALTAPVPPRALAEAAPPPNEHSPGAMRPAAQRLQRAAFSPRPAPPSAALGAAGDRPCVRQAVSDIEEDAEAELLDAVMAWNARHPPATDRATPPATSIPKPAGATPGSP